MIILVPICSNDFPLVSGINLHTKISWSTIIAAKKKNVVAPPKVSAKYGKQNAIMAAIIQWVELPSVCPFALTAFGKISEMKTQITAP
jgi:hypothetical protein